VLDARPYGRFGAQYKLQGYTCPFAAEGLAGSEYKLVCRGSGNRLVEVLRT